MSSDSQTTRNRILIATCDLLTAGSPARMSDIAKAAGVSRQAVYLHFDNRADLLVAAMRHNDDASGVEAALEPSRNAATGVARIDAFIVFWGDHAPRIHALANVLWDARKDPAARAAWDERMGAVRDGCAAAIQHLAQDGQLADPWDEDTATDLFWAMLSVRNWEMLTQERSWSQADYVAHLQTQAHRTFVAAA